MPVHYTKVMLVQSAIIDIERDQTQTQGDKEAMFSIARLICAMLMKLNDILISVNEVNHVVQTSIAGNMPSDAEASWRYMRENPEQQLNDTQMLYQLAFNEAKKYIYFFFDSLT